jgi:Lipocalin-like domain
MQNHPIVGVWKLVSFEAIRENGTPVPAYGRQPIGQLHYDASGNMSVQIMRAGRPCFQADTKSAGEEEEMLAAFDGYEAYFSTYSVDSERRTILHKVIGSLFPNWTGTVQTRSYEFQGPDRLILRTEPCRSNGRKGTVLKLVWERVR